MDYIFGTYEKINDDYIIGTEGAQLFSCTPFA